MSSPFIDQLFASTDPSGPLGQKVHDRVRLDWGGLGHLRVMDTERLSGLGVEPVLRTSELAEYLGVHVRAIYDLRTDGRGPSGIRVGRGARYRVSDLLRWQDGLHDPEPSVTSRGRAR